MDNGDHATPGNNENEPPLAGTQPSEPAAAEPADYFSLPLQRPDTRTDGTQTLEVDNQNGRSQSISSRVSHRSRGPQYRAGIGATPGGSPYVPRRPRGTRRLTHASRRTGSIAHSTISRGPQTPGYGPSQTIPQRPAPLARNFTLAGSNPFAFMIRQQTFIDPGYATLNPEYERQAQAAKPVWGLAGLLPRVVRPSMIHTPDHLKKKEARKKKQKMGDLEEGKVHRHRRLSKFDEQALAREDAYLSKVTTRSSIISEVPPAVGRPSVSRPHDEQSGGDIGLAKPFSQHTRRHDRPDIGHQPILHRSFTAHPLAEDTVDVDTRHEEDIGLSKPFEESQIPKSSQHPRTGKAAFGPTLPTLKSYGSYGSSPRQESHRKESLHFIHDDVSEEEEEDEEISSSSTEMDSDHEYAHVHGFEFMRNRHEDIPLVSCGLMEVHNHHTRWSVIRRKFREPFAEFLAVFVQLTLGVCVNIHMTVSNATYEGDDKAAWGWGLATMCGIYIGGGISGAHLNPAVSITLWIYRGFPARKIPQYALAQVLGAFAACMVSFSLYRNAILQYGLEFGTNIVSDFIAFPKYDWVTPATAFFNEFIGSSLLGVIIMALGDDSNSPPGAGMNAFIIGLNSVILSLAFSYHTGLALNPARDLGSRLALLALGFNFNLFRNTFWIYSPWAAAISGMVLGAGLYDILVFTGGESPINYPRCRMKRAVKTWKRRVHEDIVNMPRKVKQGIFGAPRKLKAGLARVPSKLRGRRGRRTMQMRDSKEIVQVFVEKLDK